MEAEKAKNHPMFYALRAVHAVIGVVFTSAISYIWYSALFSIATFWTWLAIAAHGIEGVILLFTGGECPLNTVHRRYGDQETLFQWIGGDTLDKYASKIWLALAVVGTVIVFVRIA